MMYDHGKFVAVAAALAFAASCLPCSLLAGAKRGLEAEAAARGDRIDVVGHVSLSDASISSITTSSDGRRDYVELNDGAHKTMTVIDVTNPRRPTVVKRFTLPAAFRNPSVEAMVGDAALIANGESAEPGVPKSVAIVDFADPTHPATERTFDDVSALKKSSGGLVYIADASSLWVLKQHSAHDMHAEDEYQNYLPAGRSVYHGFLN